MIKSIGHPYMVYIRLKWNTHRSFIEGSICLIARKKFSRLSLKSDPV